MHRRAWLWSLAAGLPLVMVGAWFGVRAEPGTRTEPTSLTDCCAPDCCPPDTPDCCPPNCCLVGQVTKSDSAANTNEQVNLESYTCPLTGELLPCPNCCPLKQKSAQISARNDGCPPCPLCP